MGLGNGGASDEGPWLHYENLQAKGNAEDIPHVEVASVAATENGEPLEQVAMEAVDQVILPNDEETGEILSKIYSVQVVIRGLMRQTLSRPRIDLRGKPKQIHRTVNVRLGFPAVYLPGGDRGQMNAVKYRHQLEAVTEDVRDKEELQRVDRIIRNFVGLEFQVSEEPVEPEGS